MKATTRGNETLEQFTERRKKSIGGSDIASVMNSGRYACARKLAYDKLGFEKDEDDSDRMEFRRGHRLEHVAANYYEEKTGRGVYITTAQMYPGKPHLSVTMDRLVYKKEDTEKANAGYLELKVVGRGSFIKIKKEGLIDDYVLQVQYGMAITGCKWGSYGIYCPETDELMWWDVEADEELGELLLEAADDFWNLYVGCKVLPEPLGDEPVCETCPWSITCKGKRAQVADGAIVSRPDLEPLAEKYREIKGMENEVAEAAESLREEILEAIKRKAGSYRLGRFSATFTAVEGKRFNGTKLKKDNPDLYESYREPSVTETLRLKE